MAAQETYGESKREKNEAANVFSLKICINSRVMPWE